MRNTIVTITYNTDITWKFKITCFVIYPKSYNAYYHTLTLVGIIKHYYVKHIKLKMFSCSIIVYIYVCIYTYHYFIRIYLAIVSPVF